jgi:hypothetical protein
MVKPSALVLTLLGCTLTACGGAAVAGPGSDGPASVAGTVDGKALALDVAVGDVSVRNNGLSINLTNVQSACENLVEGGGFPVDAAVLQLVVIGKGAVPTPGSYTVDNQLVRARFLAFYGSCAQSRSAESVRGTVTLGSVSSTAVSGSFDLTMFQIPGDQSVQYHLTGHFTSPECAPGAGFDDPKKCPGFSLQ